MALVGGHDPDTGTARVPWRSRVSGAATCPEHVYGQKKPLAARAEEPWNGNYGANRVASLYTNLYSPLVSDKILVWMGTSLEDLRDFPLEAKRIAGYELRRVQRGLMPTDWKAMPDVGLGVNEIRVRAGTEHRVLYVAKFEEAVYVLHAFEKKSRRTREQDLALARERLKQARVLHRSENERK